MKTIAKTADDLAGTDRTFGTEGPVDQVLRKLDDQRGRVCVVESGKDWTAPCRQRSETVK